MSTIYSIGHGTKSIGQLLIKLEENGITDLVDVRTYPRSRFNPQFNQANLEKVFSDTKIKYHWRGKNLGGLGKNVGFSETVAQMLKQSDEKTFCVMCSESDPMSCHRNSTIKPEVIKQGGKVSHILWTEPINYDNIDDEVEE